MQMLKTRILSLLKKSGFTYKKWVTGYILDKPYKTVKGSIRTVQDKDDAWLFALSKNSKVIFDIGSNIGQAALLMLYHKNIRQIILVDPNPEALSIAAENLIHNNLSIKSNFVCSFISSECDKSVDFYTQDSGAAGSIYKGFAKTAAKSDSHYTVKTLTIDYLSEYYNLVPDLIKLDIEGSERDALKGAVTVASKQSTAFFVEIHSGPELSITENTGDILSWCKSNNYKAWYLKTHEPLSIDQISKRGRYHALLLPENMPLPDSIKNIKENSKLSL